VTSGGVLDAGDPEGGDGFTARESATRREGKNDFILWIVESAAARPDSREMEPKHLPHKVIFLNLLGKSSIKFCTWPTASLS